MQAKGEKRYKNIQKRKSSSLFVPSCHRKAAQLSNIVLNNRWIMELNPSSPNEKKKKRCCTTRKLAAEKKRDCYPTMGPSDAQCAWIIQRPRGQSLKRKKRKKEEKSPKNVEKKKKKQQWTKRLCADWNVRQTTARWQGTFPFWICVAQKARSSKKQKNAFSYVKDKTNSHAQSLLWQMAVQGIKDALVTAAATSDRQCSIVLRENSLMSVCQSNGSTLTRALMSTEKKLTRENIFVQQSKTGDSRAAIL